MDWSRKALRQRVSPCPVKLVFLHTAVAVGSALLLSVLDYILMGQMDRAAGLSGMQTRAVLETIRVILQYAGTLLLPFWELGFIFAALRGARNQQPVPGDLMEGFRRFWPALRLMLLQLVIYGSVAMACMNFSVMVFMFTPLSRGLDALLEPLQNADAQALMEQLTPEQLQSAVMPGVVLFLVIFIAVMIPLLYRLRLSEFALMDKPGTGAFAAIGISNRRMKKNGWKLFRVDLQFWWFYLLQILVAVLCYADALLELAGVQLPVSDTASFFLFYLLYALCQLALHTFFRGRVQATYARIYDDLETPIEIKEQV